MSQFTRLLLATLLFFSSTSAAVANRPNILWLTAEDMSPTLGCYGDVYATTARIDKLATESLRFTNAFATSPVCSPSRACLINGLIATSQGSHPMRSAYPLPDQMRGFPSLLRQAGYFTSNNTKTDYNSGHASRIIESSWTQNGPSAHWRNRKSGQPFFSVFNFMTSHQSRTMVWDYEQFSKEVQSKLPAAQRHDPSKALVPPYYPDQPIVRKTIARFYDCVSVMDLQVGELLDQLEADGLANSTYVFFYSDHGSGMPRHKRVLLDSGMHVPLLVRAPRQARESSESSESRPRPGVTDRLVSFEDFAATVLNLAGVERPDWMRGDSILSRKPARRFVYGHRDRIDEAIDLARSVRDKRFLYVRNYMPHLGYNQYSAWADEAEIQDALYLHARSRGQSDAQRHFLKPVRAVEELYDCQQDPLNLNNLVGDPDHGTVLKAMRAAHLDYIRTSRDLGFIPEPELLKIGIQEPAMQWAAKHPKQLERAIAAAGGVGVAAEPTLLTNLAAEEAAVRYWGALGLTVSAEISRNAVAALRARLQDPSECVRLEAANALARHGYAQEALPVMIALLDHEHPTVILHAARTLEMLGPKAAAARGAIERLFKRFEHVEGDPAWFIRFTTTGFMNRIAKDTPE